jgi:TRAP-type mannitol/chloroaromatic compound transport system permease small subunit
LRAFFPYGEVPLSILLAFSRLVDRLNAWVGRIVSWLVLLSVLVSSGNAMIRYSLNTSSNAWLELQWYLFSAVFLLCAGYTLLRNEHVRIDVVASRLLPRTIAWIDIFGTVFFLMPIVVIILWLSVPVVIESYHRHEVSSNAGGLLRWPVKVLIPIGFTLLLLQAISEFVKRIAFLLGQIPDPGVKIPDHSQISDEISSGERTP